MNHRNLVRVSWDWQYAVERYGKRLRDLDERYQRDLIVDAKGMLAHYLEQ